MTTNLADGLLFYFTSAALKTNLASLASPGLVSEQASQRETAEERRRPAEVGPVLPQHEEIERKLQVGQGQHPGGGHGQRRRGVFHRCGAQTLFRVVKEL